MSFSALIRISLGLVIMLTSTAFSADNGVKQRSVEDVEKIVREYLFKHPEVILEAVERYREQQREAGQDDDHRAEKRDLRRPSFPSRGDSQR